MEQGGDRKEHGQGHEILRHRWFGGVAGSKPPAKGHKAIRASWEAYFKASPKMYLDFRPTHIEIAAGGGMATDFGEVHFAPHAKPDDPNNTAKYLVVWKRERGTWKVLYDSWNWNAAPQMVRVANK